MTDEAKPEVNSRAYWDARFGSDWDSAGGPEQSRQFMAMLLAYLPLDLDHEIRSQALSLLDCGCAQGDGTAVLARAYPGSAVAGFDLSPAAIQEAARRYPGIDFFVQEFGRLDRRADVLVSSNCLEHLREPVPALRRLLDHAERCVVLLLPFLESYPPHFEHLWVVHGSTFPEELAGWRLSHRVVVPPSPVWSQCQVLLVYRPARAATADGEGSLLAAAAADQRATELMLRAALEQLRSNLEVLTDTEETAPAATPLGSVPGRRLERLPTPVDKMHRERQQLAAELDATRLTLQGIQERGQRLERALAASRQSGKRAAAELAEAQERLEQLAAERAALELQADELRGRLAGAREQAERLARIQDVHAASLGMQLLDRFWRAAPRLLPAGSRRRGAFLRATRLLRQAFAPRGAAAPQPSPLAASPAPPPEPTLDEALARFAEHLRAGSGDRLVAIFSGTMFRAHEGQRPMQLALEFARRGVPVVFAYLRWSPGEAVPQDQLARGILQLPIDAVAADPERLARLGAGRRRLAFFEFPHPDLVETLASCNGAGWITAYDLLDDWQEFRRVGQAEWYDEEVERHFLNAADAVFAVSSPLAERAHALGRTEVEVVPNGLRPDIELVTQALPLARGEVTAGYFGYLSTAWFDWELLCRAATERPSWKFHVIGYGDAPGSLPANVVLLGPKEPSKLAAYARNWDVAIVPFRPGRLAAGADPIKVYEYLAMGLPVVVTGVTAPTGAEHLVRRAASTEEFLAAIAAAASEPDRGRREFARRCTWEARVDALSRTLEERGQRVGEKLGLIGQ
jgi:glycosyltransferase involved in cell wall biosynthesis/SAM-dependent methyltransferase